MKIKCLFAALLLSLACVTEAQDYVQYVNPLMGTQSSFELSAGNTYPVIARPWGMNFWTPQTGKMGDGWQYTYDAHKIRGFKQTHQPSPWINDFGQFALMPLVGTPEPDEDKRASWFSHKGEEAHPHYYKVYLADYDILTELAPTERAALFRFTFPQTDSAYVVVDAFDRGSYVKLIPGKNRVIGYSTRNSGGVPDNFRNYFIIEFDRPFASHALFSNGRRHGKGGGNEPLVLHDSLLECGDFHTGAIVGFRTRRGERVHARVASSFISWEQAERNLRELGGDSLETLVRKGREAWNDVLRRIEVEGGTLDQYRTFYSCLYRSLLFPHRFYEWDAAGNPVHYSPMTGDVRPGYYYTGTGVWDTFRCLFPLLNLLYPSMSLEMQEGFLNAYRESGFYPEWASPGHRNCMVGNNTASVLADAWLKGICVSDTATLWRGLMASVNGVHPSVPSSGRLGYEYYNTLGYVPCDVGINESAARTLEYAYDDWCLYRLAQALRRPQHETGIFARRAMNYRHLFDPQTLLMRGKKADGTFASPFSPLKWGGDFTEGNAWHYTWSVFHDPQGLISLMGGNEAFIAMLDSVFRVPPLYDDSYYGFPIHEIREMTVMNMGNYAHGNQPVQHMIYLYNYAGAPWKAQYWLREVLDRMYTPAPDGYCGDEDNGQTSAWYVFTALGFYPVCPASGEYVLGAPLFRRAVLHLENGHDVLLRAPENSPANRYVGRLLLNGREYTRNYLRHADLLRGATLDFRMQPRPDTLRGTLPEDCPYSFSRPPH